MCVIFLRIIISNFYQPERKDLQLYLRLQMIVEYYENTWKNILFERKGVLYFWNYYLQFLSA